MILENDSLARLTPVFRLSKAGEQDNIMNLAQVVGASERIHSSDHFQLCATTTVPEALVENPSGGHQIPWTPEGLQLVVVGGGMKIRPNAIQRDPRQ